MASTTRDNLKYSPLPTDGQTLSPAKRAPNVATAAVDDMSHENVADETDLKIGDVEEGRQKKKIPRRVLHFSDGILEEYSTDEEEEKERERQKNEQERRSQAIVDPKTLTWIPWVVHHTWFAGSSLLRYCDSWGERLAWFFGITSPKYFYELEEYKRMKEEEEREEKKLEQEMHGWTEAASNPEVVGSDPTKSHETS